MEFYYNKTQLDIMATISTHDAHTIVRSSMAGYRALKHLRPTVEGEDGDYTMVNIVQRFVQNIYDLTKLHIEMVDAGCQLPCLYNLEIKYPNPRWPLVPFIVEPLEIIEILEDHNIWRDKYVRKAEGNKFGSATAFFTFDWTDIVPDIKRVWHLDETPVFAAERTQYLARG